MDPTIYDISPLISDSLAVYPNDLPFSFQSETKNGIRVSSIQSTLHLGAHVDAPSHFCAGASIDELPLHYFVGTCQLVRFKLPQRHAITPSDFERIEITEQRLLVATETYNPNRWTDDFAAFHPETIDFLHSKGVLLVGIDTPSVDVYAAVDYPVHRRMAALGMPSLEGLQLSDVPEGLYGLVALPLRLRGLEASPVRAVLLEL